MKSIERIIDKVCELVRFLALAEINVANRFEPFNLIFQQYTRLQSHDGGVELDMKNSSHGSKLL